MSIRLLPPCDAAPQKQFVLPNGTLIRPASDGSATVHDQDDVDLLLTKDWTPDAKSERAANFRSTMLQKAATSHANHVTGAAPHPRTEFGEVDTGERHGRVTVSHDQASDVVSVHGVNFDLSNIDSGLRSAFRAASAAYVNAAQEVAEQTDAKALIGVVVGAVLNRHEFIGARVRERLLDLRYRAI